MRFPHPRSPERPDLLWYPDERIGARAGSPPMRGRPGYARFACATGSQHRHRSHARFGREGAAPGRLATADIYLCMSAELDGEDDMRVTAGFTK
jgi:hypothetical protein